MEFTGDDREKLTSLYEDDPEVAHGVEDDILWEVVRQVAEGRDMSDACKRLVAFDLEHHGRARWYA